MGSTGQDDDKVVQQSRDASHQEATPAIPNEGGKGDMEQSKPHDSQQQLEELSQQAESLKQSVGGMDDMHEKQRQLKLLNIQQKETIKQLYKDEGF